MLRSSVKKDSEREFTNYFVSFTFNFSVPIINLWCRFRSSSPPTTSYFKHGLWLIMLFNCLRKFVRRYKIVAFFVKLLLPSLTTGNVWKAPYISKHKQAVDNM